ncbi:hypothetical protein DSAG12_02717 [Promethearchaeum syntrophicum]|uniref:Uncharacterized protein n=1 Tax=Promethearchaeum syntrophicum TaxID=2594042 RepID=A0A5B9DDD6_9ARCH|nr:hypothetical protein [Candidatus Prometheoarchaeum syntrophicum]QEE16887.1 hypothetical protein DSAG12_02717 [Candidatus Prometheoarchaeum syntrophicum]
MGFSEEDLVNYFSKGKNYVPKEAMKKLNQLLFKELGEYCQVCEEDRMICVLSPMCPRRILLKVRIQSGANKDDLPKFCYSQAVNNLKRYMKKLTTLYKPVDELVYNKDFIDIMFPKLYDKFVSYFNTDIDRIHQLIESSKVPAEKFDINSLDNQIFRKIINQNKLIREGTFIYHITENLLLIWYEEAIFISDFSDDSHLTICNAKYDVIVNLKIIQIVFQIYCAQYGIIGHSILNSPNQISLEMKVPNSEISQDLLDNNSVFFSEIIIFLQEFFSEIEISQDSDNFMRFSIIYQNVEHFLKRNMLKPLTYKSIESMIEKINGLKIDKIK